MFKTLLEHIIYETALNTLFHGIQSSFPVIDGFCEESFKKIMDGQVVKIPRERYFEFWSYLKVHEPKNAMIFSESWDYGLESYRFWLAQMDGKSFRYLLSSPMDKTKKIERVKISNY